MIKNRSVSLEYSFQAYKLLFRNFEYLFKGYERIF